MADAKAATEDSGWEEAEDDAGWAEADAIPTPAQQEDEDDEGTGPVELESRIVTEVLSADLNPFNIEERD